MKLIACMLVRNEAWVLRASLRAALSWCDEMVVALHACTDASTEMVCSVGSSNPGRVHILIDSDRDRWREMEQRQRMLEEARYHGATHIAIVDADEILTANFEAGAIRRMLEDAGDRLMEMPLYNLRNGISFYHADGIWGNRWTTLAFKDQPHFRWSGETYHSREPAGSENVGRVRLVHHGEGGVLHLWGSSETRLRAKHALYKLTDPRRKQMGDFATDQQYSWAIHGDAKTPQFGTPHTWKYEVVPAAWWDNVLAFQIDTEEVPWQIAEVKRLLREHPGIGDNMDLFGIPEL